MIKRIVLILGGLGMAATGALAQDAGPPEPAPELKALADSCAAHKFETLVVVDASGRGKKVKICGKPGQSDDEWVVTLKDSVRKVKADAAMAASVREQIVAALKVEIDRLETAATADNLIPVASIEVSKRPVIIPEAPPQYSSVPPLPPPLPRATPGKTTAAAAAPIARPRLSVRCALPHESFVACARLERETQLLVRADEDIAAGTSLRFLRGGEDRAEIDVGSLKKGESLRERLPARVCSGVLRGRVEVQVLSKGQVAGTEGPYVLYCGS